MQSKRKTSILTQHLDHQTTIYSFDLRGLMLLAFLPNKNKAKFFFFFGKKFASDGWNSPWSVYVYYVWSLQQSIVRGSSGRITYFSLSARKLLFVVSSLFFFAKSMLSCCYNIYLFDRKDFPFLAPSPAHSLSNALLPTTTNKRRFSCFLIGLVCNTMIKGLQYSRPPTKEKFASSHFLNV